MATSAVGGNAPSSQASGAARSHQCGRSAKSAANREDGVIGGRDHRVVRGMEQELSHTREMHANPLPRHGLFDSHISDAQGCAVFDESEVVESPAHHLWSWFAIVSGPAAEAGNGPGGEGEGTLGVGVLLPRGVA